MTRRSVITLAVGIAAGCLWPAQVVGQWPWERWHPEEHIPGMHLNAFRVHIRNQTPYPLLVQVKWYRMPEGSSTFEGMDGFETASYDFAPGEEAYIGDTKGRNIFFRARSKTTRHRWQAHGGGFVPVDMGPRFVDYTYSFTP